MFLSDGYLALAKTLPSDNKGARFLRLLSRLPMELQMKMCNVAFGLAGHFVSVSDTEHALRRYALKFRRE